MENYITINGKKVELTEEQLEKLGIKPEKNKYEELFKREYNEYYYLINSKGALIKFREFWEPDGVQNFSVGNYCHDEAIMKQRALHETLNRLLWRASVIAGELDNEWNTNNAHYCIYYDHGSNSLKIDCDDTWQTQGTCYFPTIESAKEAIENIVKPFMKVCPNFVW